jgi:hypothetical protein
MGQRSSYSPRARGGPGSPGRSDAGGAPRTRRPHHRIAPESDAAAGAAPSVRLNLCIQGVVPSSDALLYIVTLHRAGQQEHAAPAWALPGVPEAGPAEAAAVSRRLAPPGPSGSGGGGGGGGPARLTTKPFIPRLLLPSATAETALDQLAEVRRVLRPLMRHGCGNADARARRRRWRLLRQLEISMSYRPLQYAGGGRCVPHCAARKLPPLPLPLPPAAA